MEKVIIVSGYFNPLHKGHIEYFNNAKSQGDKLFVIVNSDLQRALKGSKEFMKQDERLCIVENLKMVDTAMVSVDQDRTVCDSLRFIHSLYRQMPGGETVLAFANGGDRVHDNIPEIQVCVENNVEMLWNVGGGKIQSSSDLIKRSTL